MISDTKSQLFPPCSRHNTNRIFAIGHHLTLLSLRETLADGRSTDQRTSIMLEFRVLIESQFILALIFALFQIDVRLICSK